jgi:hypothetical protein
MGEEASENKTVSLDGVVWEIADRPGYSGFKKAEKTATYDQMYGPGNWRVAWLWNGEVVSREFAIQLYEDGYYQDSFERERIWVELVRAASDVYDIEPRDVESGLDYTIQQAGATHLQDIAIRKVVKRRGWKFEGDELVQVRGRNNYWGKTLGPGSVQFHIPESIEQPRLSGWWRPDSIEDFYQSNKVLLVSVPNSKS